MNWRRALVGAAVVVVLLIGGYLVYQQFFTAQQEPETTTQAGDTTAADINSLAVDTGADVVAAEGQIVPLRSARLSFEVGGIVREIVTPAGSAVLAGDPILQLDGTDQEIALTQAQAALAQAEAGLETAQAGQLAAETGVRAAEIGVQAAEVQLALVTAEPTAEQVALQQSSIDIAQATINQAASNQQVVLQGARGSQLEAAEAQLRAAEAQALPVREALDQLRREDSPDEDALAQAQARYNAAQARINAAQARLDELQSGATAGEQQAASGAVAAAVAQRNAAEAQLELLLAGAREEEITVAEAGVEEANAALVEAQLAQQQAAAAVQQAEANVAQAQAAVNSAQAALDKMTLTAPFAGTVADITVDLGEVVGAGSPVVVVADFSGWLVETTDLSELDVVALKVGDPVEISVDAIPGETLTGTVTDIATSSTLTRGDVTYTVEIRLDAPDDLPLRWGMTVFVNVDVDQS